MTSQPQNIGSLYHKVWSTKFFPLKYISLSLSPIGVLVLMLFPFNYSQILLNKLYVSSTGLIAGFIAADDLCTHGAYNLVGKYTTNNYTNKYLILILSSPSMLV